MGLNVTILPVVTEDIPISPRFALHEFSSRGKFSTLTTHQHMVEFYSRSHALRYGINNTIFALTRIELTTSALLAGVQITN